jgi:hypothetical protein
MFFVADRQMVGNEGDVDIGLSDEESLHSFSVVALGVVPAGSDSLAPDPVCTR